MTTRGPLSYMAKHLIALTPDGDWEFRFNLFRAGIKAIVDAANHPALDAAHGSRRVNRATSRPIFLYIGAIQRCSTARSTG